MTVMTAAIYKYFLETWHFWLGAWKLNIDISYKSTIEMKGGRERERERVQDRETDSNQLNERISIKKVSSWISAIQFSTNNPNFISRFFLPKSRINKFTMKHKEHNKSPWNCFDFISIVKPFSDVTLKTSRQDNSATQTLDL